MRTPKPLQLSSDEPKQRHSSFGGLHKSCWLRSVCWDLFLICACWKRLDRYENTGPPRISIRVDDENCAFFAHIKEDEKP
jgi:hypothetical protein